MLLCSFLALTCATSFDSALNPLFNVNLRSFYYSEEVEAFRYRGVISAEEMRAIGEIVIGPALDYAGPSLMQHRYGWFLERYVGLFISEMDNALLIIKSVTSDPSIHLISIRLPVIESHITEAMNFGEHAQAYWLLMMAAASLKRGDEFHVIATHLPGHLPDLYQIPDQAMIGPQLESSVMHSTYELLKAIADHLEGEIDLSTRATMDELLKKQGRALNLMEETEVLQRFLGDPELVPSADQSITRVSSVLSLWRDAVQGELDRRACM